MAISKLIDILHKENCSLVLQDREGNVSLFSKKGVRDLEWLLDNSPERLRGATIADKVIGKAAAGMMAFGGVAEVYADVMSRKAIPLLADNGVDFSFGKLVEQIVIPAGDSRCPLENIVDKATTAAENVEMLRKHFAEMTRKNMTRK